MFELLQPSFFFLCVAGLPTFVVFWNNSSHLENDLCRLICSMGNSLILHVLRTTIKDCSF